MELILNLLHLNMLTIAKAIINPMFFVAIIIVSFIQKKMNQFNIYGYKHRRQTLYQMVESTILGIVAGVMICLVMSLIGLPIRLTDSMILLLPISLLLSLIHPQYFCMSYSASILCLLSFIFSGQHVGGLIIPNLEVDISGLMVLISVLHLLEGIFVYFYGAKYAFPILTKRKNQIIIGQMMQGMWPVPLSLLVVMFGSQGGESLHMPEWWPLVDKFSLVYGIDTMLYTLLPIIGVMGYRTVTFSYQPITKARYSAFQLFAYSLGLLGFALFAPIHPLIQFIGVCYMALAHEFIIKLSEVIEERRAPIYTIPKHGVAVMALRPEGIGETMGLEVGDVIYKLNGRDIKGIDGYKEIMEEGCHYLWLEATSLNNQTKKLEYKDYQHLIKKLDFQPVPNRPRIIIKYSTVHSFNLLNNIMNKLKKNV